MRILIIKMSSLGDVIHTFPALTDVLKAYPEVQVDWLIEESFVTLARLHPIVKNIIPIKLRAWRRGGDSYKQRLHEIKAFIKRLRQTHYDVIIDAQGLLKSALTGMFARGPRMGYNSSSARERLASLFYKRRFPIAKNQHAITRSRQLFAQSLDYDCPTSPPEYKLNAPSARPTEDLFCMFLHATTWQAKHWPEAYWQALAFRITQTGLKVFLPWGNDAEYAQAERIRGDNDQVVILPRLNLLAISAYLAHAHSIVAVDTGLAHLAAALDTKVLALYGPTDYIKTGVLGQHQVNLQGQYPCVPCLQKQCTFVPERAPHPPCFDALSVELVYERWQELVAFKAQST